MNLDVIGYAISTAVLRAFGVPLWAALGMSFAMGSAFRSDGTQSCLCVQNRPVVGMYEQLAAALSKPAGTSLRLPGSAPAQSPAPAA
jgi:hypothetical protein